jgi:hypothetical protein
MRLLGNPDYNKVNFVVDGKKKAQLLVRVTIDKSFDAGGTGPGTP